MPLALELYSSQRARWPTSGRHILCQHDAESVIIYQAYAPHIGRFAAKHRFFGGDFKLTRMSWIKPNFLWMMHRAGWATKTNQEMVLAVWLRRDAFESLLVQAVHSSYVPEVYGSREVWQKRIAHSDVRLQWDPDHSPTGTPEKRRALQLGLQGETLRRYAKEWILNIEDITHFVREQREHVVNHRLEQLLTPRETVLWPMDEATVQHLGLDT
jgi:hypothetical protein